MEYIKIVNHYEKCFEQHGCSPKGVDWTQGDQADIPYQVMLKLIYFRLVRLLKEALH